MNRAIRLAAIGLLLGAVPHGAAAAPLSAVAQLGRHIFFDAGLSSSGRLACASCHSPAHAYGQPNALPAQFGGPKLARQGVRAVPSLEYLERQPNFSIGPDNPTNETAALPKASALNRLPPRPQKTALGAPAANFVPQGGLFWDGRADTLQDQAMVPLLSPFEMDGGSVEAVARRLRRAPYAASFATVFGKSIFENPRLLVAEAMFAVARYQIEDADFHPYTSKFDAWRAGRARLTPAEKRGYLVFNDAGKGNCAACHTDRPGPDGLPPLFTDHQYEALGVPRNPALAANRDPAYFDLGICGPYRTNMKAFSRYCGFFLTPTLRNVATRHVFFHNGVYHSLRQALDFYDFRDTDPRKIYSRGADGGIEKFDDLPPRYRANVDRVDPPFTRKRGETPPMTGRDERDLIAFLNTLSDGYRIPAAVIASRHR